jgi:GT2 family glycosyltransferase
MNVTAVLVNYLREDLLSQCMLSIRRFYPTMKVVIIDGSPAGQNHFAKTFADQYTFVDTRGYNVGHGKGMHLGIQYCRTKYFLLVDTDVIVNRPVIDEMMQYMHSGKYYGVGQVVQVNALGGNVKRGIPYLHPHFALIDKYLYERYPAFVHHGAPCIKTMIELDGKIPIFHFPVWDYITHLGRGTRILNPPEFRPDFWDRA